MEDIGNMYNKKCPGVKRLMREAIEMAEVAEDFAAKPLEDNLFEWHFTIRGQKGSDFQGGLYHGRIILPKEYPMKPPSIILLTPNGRFDVNKKICLSISGHHPETWQPSWSIRTALVALIAFMPMPSEGTIGSLDYTPTERQILAKKSRTWHCQHCGPISRLLASETLTEEEINSVALKSATVTKTLQPVPINNVPDTQSPAGYISPRDVLVGLLVLALGLCVLRRWTTFVDFFATIFASIYNLFSN